MEKKYFTVESAQKLIPKIKKSILRLQSLKKSVESVASVRIEPGALGQEELITTSTKLSKEYHKLSYEFYLELERLEKNGCILKDLELGLVDFYNRFEERDIFLCWKIGESRLIAWHETDSGYSERQQIVDLSDYQK